MRRTITEIHGTTLSMTDAEITEILPDLDAAALTSLRELTVGWPAGVRLAALAWQEGANPRAFDGRDRLVRDYLQHDALATADASGLVSDARVRCSGCSSGVTRTPSWQRPVDRTSQE